MILVASLDYHILGLLVLHMCTCLSRIKFLWLDQPRCLLLVLLNASLLLQNQRLAQRNLLHGSLVLLLYHGIQLIAYRWSFCSSFCIWNLSLSWKHVPYCWVLVPYLLLRWFGILILWTDWYRGSTFFLSNSLSPLV